MQINLPPARSWNRADRRIVADALDPKSKTCGYAARSPWCKLRSSTSLLAMLSGAVVSRPAIQQSP
jgi:hypothetical protein